MEELNHQICPVKLFLSREKVGFFDRNARNACKHGNKQLLDSNIVMLPTPVIFRAVEPENADIPAQTGVFPVTGELHELRFCHWLVGSRICSLSKVSCHEEAN